MNFYSLTDIGISRDSNEDCFHNERLSEGMLLVICDGMGGHKHGALASQIASEKFVEYFIANQNSSANLLKLLYESVNIAGEEVYKKSKEIEFANNMGTTIVAILVSDDTCYAINVGDSRAYIKNRYGFHQITKDHTYINELIEHGSLTEEQARSSSKRNILTRGLGFQEMDQPDATVLELEKENQILLCSDGLTGALSNVDIDAILSSDLTLEDKCLKLKNMAIDQGSKDNITITIYQH